MRNYIFHGDNITVIDNSVTYNLPPISPKEPLKDSAKPIITINWQRLADFLYKNKHWFIMLLGTLF